MLTMRFKLVCLILQLCDVALGLFEQCNHAVTLKANEKIYITSPYYPNAYPLGTSCRYTVHAATPELRLNFKCRLDLNVPSGATRCQYEAFYFNREGSELLTNSDYFCGTGEIERKSFLNHAVISYVSMLQATDTTATAIKLNKLKTNELASSKSEPQTNATKTTRTTTTITTTTTTTTTPAPFMFPTAAPDASAAAIPPAPFNLSSKETEALTYILTLLNQTLATTTTTAATTTATASETAAALTTTATPLNQMANDIISKLMWRQPVTSLANATGTGGARKAPRIVSNAITDDGDGELSNGGGRFSCLVEVIGTEQCECGWSNARLKVAGIATEAAVNEFSPMAGILTKQMGRIFCGGTIINQRYVLSAAHCFTTPSTNRATLLQIVAGEHDTSTAAESYYTRYYDIETLIVHEDFRSTLMTLRNDVALLRTADTIEWNRGVGPACLPWRWANGSYSGQAAALRRQRPPRAGQRLDTAGWGTTSFGGPQATRLLKTSLDVISADRCRQQLHVLPAHTFCTYTPGSDTCQYDSGGGLYARHNSRLYAVGVVSYGYACASAQPSVNVRVAAFLKWIKRNTPDVTYCKK